MRTKRPMLASSSGASTSSRMQNGEGLYWKIANRSEIAVSAFSPPESSITFCRRLPGGCAITSMPLSRRSSSSIRVRPAVPPPKSCRKISPKCWLMTWKASWKRSREALSIFLMAWSSSAIESSRSWRCAVRKVWRSSSSCACSTARTLTGPMLVEPLAHLLDLRPRGPPGPRRLSSSVRMRGRLRRRLATAWWHSRARWSRSEPVRARATSSSASASRSMSRSRRRSFSAGSRPSSSLRRSRTWSSATATSPLDAVALGQRLGEQALRLARSALQLLAAARPSPPPRCSAAAMRALQLLVVLLQAPALGLDGGHALAQGGQRAPGLRRSRTCAASLAARASATAAAARPGARLPVVALAPRRWRAPARSRPAAPRPRPRSCSAWLRSVSSTAALRSQPRHLLLRRRPGRGGWRPAPSRRRGCAPRARGPPRRPPPRARPPPACGRAARAAAPRPAPAGRAISRISRRGASRPLTPRPPSTIDPRSVSPARVTQAHGTLAWRRSSSASSSVSHDQARPAARRGCAPRAARSRDRGRRAAPAPCGSCAGDLAQGDAVRLACARRPGAGTRRGRRPTPRR